MKNSLILRTYTIGLCAIFTVLILAAQSFAAIDVNNSFSSATVYPGQTSRLTVTLLNSSLVPSTNISFMNALPNNVFVAAVPNTVTSCGGIITTNNTATNGEISFSGGTIPAGTGSNSGKCSIQMDVYSNRKGTYINEFPAGAVTGTTNGALDANIQVSQGTLAVILQDLSGTISFDSGDYIQGTERNIQRIKLTNPNPVPLTGVSFLNSQYGSSFNIRAINDGTQTSTCGGIITITPRPANNSQLGATSDVSFSGGTIPANGSCEISFKVESTRDSTKPYYGLTTTSSINQNNVTTTEGATNTATISAAVGTVNGILINKYFESASINYPTVSTARFHIQVASYNTTAISNFSLTDVMPLVSGGAMTATNIVSSSCGTVTNGTTQITVASGKVAANTPNVAGLQQANCEIIVDVAVNAAGTYTNKIPAGNLSGFQYNATQGSLSAVETGIFEITKSFSRNIYQGDTVDLILNMKNNSTTKTVSNIDLLDDLNSMCVAPYCGTPQIKVDSIVSNTCGGTVTATPGSTNVKIDNAQIAPSTSCAVTVKLKTASDIYPIGTRTNKIPAANITYDLPGSPGNTYPTDVYGYLYVYNALILQKSFTPAIVGPTGLTRLRIAFTRHSQEDSKTKDIAFKDTLPAGHVVADNPNIANTCGGTVTATPGSNIISLSGGTFNTSNFECDVDVTVRAPALTPPNTIESSTNIIPGDTHGSPINVSAKDTKLPDGSNQLENYYQASAVLTRKASNVTLNKEFTPVSISGGGVSRVRVTLSNIEPSAINLTGVKLSDVFTGTDLRLYSNVDAAFTDLNGNPNSNGCRGGLFSGNSGDTSITLSDASIDAGKICRFEFNITAFKGGNHINRLAAGALMTNEGITNPSNVAATLTVGRQVNVGKGFSPAIIGEGDQSTLTLDFYNTNIAPNDETGANGALTDLLPEGMHVVGTPTTTCAGGVVTTGTNGSREFIRLDGGTFPAENICKVIAKVTTNGKGSFTNSIAAGDLKTVSGAENPDPASATLRVIAKPTITKYFSNPRIGQGGLSAVGFTITNPNDAAILPTGLTGASFSDVLTDMTIASPVYVYSDCAGYTHNAVAGGTSFTISNMSIAPGSSCTVYVDVTSNIIGVHDNQSSGVTSNQTPAPGNPSNIAKLTVFDKITVVKEFQQTVGDVGEPAGMIIYLQNATDAPVTVNNFKDVFPTTPGQMTLAYNPYLSDCGTNAVARNLTDTADANTGDTGFLLKNAEIPANRTCTIYLSITAAAAGTYVNTTSILETSIGNTAAATAQMDFIKRGSISGVIFEDVNYGGGFGRSLSASNGVPRPYAQVFLYKDNLMAQQTYTDQSGKYTFKTLDAGNYSVRADNNISSSRGYAFVTSVQTFRTDAGSGTPVPVTNKVGGENPKLQDTYYWINNLADLSTLPADQTIQSLAPVKLVGTNDISGVDFGFNFDTIVNTNESGQGSLNAFISNTNQMPNAGLNQESNAVFDPAAGEETSIFMIPTAGDPLNRPLDPNCAGLVCTISANNFDPIFDSVTIDGRTQRGYNGSPLIELSGTSSSYNSLTIYGFQREDFKIRGLAINNFPENAIYGHSVKTMEVAYNYIGTDTTGTTAKPNGNGITLEYGGQDINIHDNLISGNTAANGKTARGISFSGAQSSKILGNKIGTDITGTKAIPNEKEGIYLEDVSDITIGGTSAERNIISGNLADGISLNRAANLNINGNYIGVDISGENALVNKESGILVNESTNSVVGISGAGNVIASNDKSDSRAIALLGAGTTNIRVQANRVGVTPSSKTILANNANGIFFDNASANFIGEGNIISGFRSGISGKSGLNNQISKNSIYANAELGIDLDPQGVTLNDANDADDGANHLLNFPIVEKTITSSGTLTIIGCAPKNSVIELFKTDISMGTANAGDNRLGKTQDYGEGQSYLTTLIEGDGSDTDTGVGCANDADGNDQTGMNRFKFTIPIPAGIAVGDLMTATATIAGDGTSEFSPVILMKAGLPKIDLLKSCTVPADCTINPQIPGTDLTYKIEYTNSGENLAQNLIVVDPIPAYTDFKLNSATSNAANGMTFVIEYSADFDPANPTAATWTYTPLSAGGGADADYDRLVKAVRWRVTTGNLSEVSPNNKGDVSFIAKIR